MVRRIAACAWIVAWTLALTVSADGCAPRGTPPAVVTVRWLAARPMPAFDPDGPPSPLREALERALTCGLFARDSGGVVRGAAAESAIASADGRLIEIRLRAGLRFTDGSPVTADDARDALLAGLAREDHATRAWLLGAVEGMDRVRAGRPLPALGIEARDERTLVLRLSRPDPQLLSKLAVPAAGMLWKSRAAASWGGAVGVGPYRVAAEEAGRSLTLVRADAVGAVRANGGADDGAAVRADGGAAVRADGGAAVRAAGAVARAAVDTLAVRFTSGAPRVRTLMRLGAADFVWPLPPGLTAAALPAGWERRRLAADPPRRLLLVLRADVPPTTRLPARHALAHATNTGELAAALGVRAAPEPWLEGAPTFETPSFDAALVRQWMERGRLGASFHVVLAFDADGAGAEVARALQGQWADQGIYAELRALRGPDAAAEPLRAAAAQAQLVEARAPLPGPAAELATLVMPLRGPAVGAFRSGWRTREFDPWITGAPAGAPLDAARAQERVCEERIALPIATLPWVWLARVGSPAVRFAPDRGPVFDLQPR